MRLLKQCRVAASMITISAALAISCSSAGVFVGDSPAVAGGPAVVGGPPPHAPAWGYRAKHTYYYYPDSSVYFDTGRNVYFYLDGGNWRMTASLPANLGIQLGEHVTISMDSDKPYVAFAEHKQKYPPGQMKKSKNHKK